MRAKRSVVALLAAGASLVLAWAVPTAANASTHRASHCAGGTLATGVYNGLVVKGTCNVATGATVTINGNVRLDDGAVFNAINMSTVIIRGHVYVDDGAVFGLGCTLLGVGAPRCTGNTHDVVFGNIVADDPLSMYLDGDTIMGNVTSHGGGPGLASTVTTNFPIKDNYIGGDVTVTDWHGFWFGLIRNTIVGDASVHGVKAVNPDSTEIVHNTVGEDLRCWHNTPAAQFGDAVQGMPAGYGPNLVGDDATGECAALAS